MEARFTNGASVNRIYAGRGAATELLACFQYETDALEFAKAKLTQDEARNWMDSTYVVSNMYTGTIAVIRHASS